MNEHGTDGKLTERTAFTAPHQWPPDQAEAALHRRPQRTTLVKPHDRSTSCQLSKMQGKPYHLLLHPDTWRKAAKYLAELRESPSRNCGARLRTMLADAELTGLSTGKFIEYLLATKQPQIFAERSVLGDGSDWNQRELSILGDLGLAIPVTVYDDGQHRNPHVHEPPFPGTLLFTPGALLRNDTGRQPADWSEVTHDGMLDLAAYRALYQRRLLPLLLYADAGAAAAGMKALVTLPGLGCGQFAGPFRGCLGEALKDALIALLQHYGAKLPNIRALYYDPFEDCDNARYTCGGVALLVRPLKHGNWRKPQLCRPRTYEDDGDDFSDCLLFSLVAWDHVSWPGNDFYLGSRATDDGVKAAATNAMAAITGIEGRYDRDFHAYQPPSPYQTWGQLVVDRCVRLVAVDRIAVLPELSSRATNHDQ